MVGFMADFVFLVDPVKVPSLMFLHVLTFWYYLGALVAAVYSPCACCCVVCVIGFDIVWPVVSFVAGGLACIVEHFLSHLWQL